MLLPCRHRLGILHYAMAVSGYPGWPASLSGANSHRIPCWGERFFTVTIDGVPCQWVFLLAAVSFSILGIDFLHHHSLVVDVANLRLSSPPSLVSAVVARRSYADAVRSPPAVSPPHLPGTVSFPGGSSPPLASPAAAVFFPATSDWLATLQRQFPKVFFQGAATSSLAPARACAILLQLYTSTERLIRVYTSPGTILEICYLR
jgi:hypothetical protein